jgi:hypothetical protein
VSRAVELHNLAWSLPHKPCFNHSGSLLWSISGMIRQLPLDGGNLNVSDEKILPGLVPIEPFVETGGELSMEL